MENEKRGKNKDAETRMKFKCVQTRPDSAQTTLRGLRVLSTPAVLHLPSLFRHILAGKRLAQDLYACMKYESARACMNTRDTRSAASGHDKELRAVKI